MKARKRFHSQTDRKLTYWHDWRISGEDGQIIIDLRNYAPPFDEERLSDIDYLCKCITDFPEATLMRSEVWYRIIMLRQRSLKDKDAVDSLRRVCKAILGDGRRRKKLTDFANLKDKITQEIEFFKYLIESKSKSDVTVDKIIYTYLTKDAIDDNDFKKSEQQLRNYQTVYYAYKKIYDLLSEKLTDNEIFVFLEQAANSIHEANTQIDVVPDKRLLTFVKMKTWYIYGSDMHIKQL